MSGHQLCGQPTAEGTPCQQRHPCLWHGPGVTAEDRRELARRGGLAARWKTLPPDTPAPSFDSREAIVRFAEEHARLVLTGQLEPKLAAEARGFALLALTAHELAALDRLERLEKIVVKGRRLA